MASFVTHHYKSIFCCVKFINIRIQNEVAYPSVDDFCLGPVLRNGGVGSKMLKALTEDAEKMIILEVEPPTEEIAVRRVRFYERNGFFFNDYPYIQPSMGEGRKETPLFLMSTERKIDEEEYRMIRNTLYTKVYGKKDVLERERFIDMC